VVPTPVHSIETTPLSSAYPSTYASEDEWEGNSRMIARYPVRVLTQHDFDSKAAQRPPKKAEKPFRFLDLPAELRLRIYAFHFEGLDNTLDLAPDNHKKIHKKLAIFQTCRTIHQEASYAFFSQHVFRIFPTHGLYYKAKKPLLARMTSRQREQITVLELRVGPGFNKPPRSWKVNSALGLADCMSVKRVDVFVECDPSDKWFNGFRRADGFYEEFCGGLLSQVLAAVPSVEQVSFDGNSTIRKQGAMMRSLLAVTSAAGRPVRWGSHRGWTDGDEVEIEPLAAAFAALAPVTSLLSTATPSLVAVA